MTARVLRFALWALGGWYLALFVILAAQHIIWPFELEWMEGGMLDHVHRLLQGQALYAPPSLEFTAFSYAPLYFYCAAALSALFGASFALLRAISAAACLGSLLLITVWVKQESGSRQAGFLAAVLYLACYPVSGAWYDLARVDSLFLLLLLGGLYLQRCHGRTPAGAAAAALLLAFAAFCKQTALVITLPVLAWHLWSTPGRRRWLLPLLYLVLVGGGYALMQAASDGWCHYYLFYLPGQHPPVWWRVHHFWIDYFFKPLPLATLLGAALLLGGRLMLWQRDRYWFFLAAGLFGGPWLAVVPSGAYHNAVMPAHAALAILCGLLLGRAGKQRTWILAAAVAQLLLLLYAPGRYLPAPADREAGQRLVQELAAVPGAVWIPGQGYLAELAGKAGSAHRCALDDVLRGGDEPGKQALQAEWAKAMNEGRYAVVITGAEGMAADGKIAYRPGRRIFPQEAVCAAAPASGRAWYRPGRKSSARDGCFFPLTGWQTRPEWWYERRGE